MISRAWFTFALDQQVRLRDLNVWNRRIEPFSSFPFTSTNSRLLGFKPSVATFDVMGSPKDGTGQLHGMMLDLIFFNPSRRLRRTRIVSYARCVSSGINLEPFKPTVPLPPLITSRRSGNVFGKTWRIHLWRHSRSSSFKFDTLRTFGILIALKNANKIWPIRGQF